MSIVVNEQLVKEMCIIENLTKAERYCCESANKRFKKKGLKNTIAN